MNKRRFLRRVKYYSNVLIIVLMTVSLGLGYSVSSDLYDLMREDVVEVTPEPIITCNKKIYKAEWDCRKKLVDNHYDKWKEKKHIIKQYCAVIAKEMYCEES